MRKYSVSKRNIVIRVVGPMMIAWRRRVGENDEGTRRRNVIMDVGRSRTANDANIKDLERLLYVSR